MKIYMASWIEDENGTTLTRAGGNRRLLSYILLKQRSKSFLIQYVKEGIAKWGKNEIK